EARGTTRSLMESVLVEAGARRPPPETEARVAASFDVAKSPIVPIEAIGRTGDGFIARLETREWREGVPGAWPQAGSPGPEGPALRAWIEVERTPGVRRLEVRAVDGQGIPDPT